MNMMILVSISGLTHMTLFEDTLLRNPVIAWFTDGSLGSLDNIFRFQRGSVRHTPRIVSEIATIYYDLFIAVGRCKI